MLSFCISLFHTLSRSLLHLINLQLLKDRLLTCQTHMVCHITIYTTYLIDLMLKMFWCIAFLKNSGRKSIFAYYLYKLLRSAVKKLFSERTTNSSLRRIRYDGDIALMTRKQKANQGFIRRNFLAWSTTLGRSSKLRIAAVFFTWNDLYAVPASVCVIWARVVGKTDSDVIFLFNLTVENVLRARIGSAGAIREADTRVTEEASILGIQ